MVCRQKACLGEGIPRRLGFRDQRHAFAIEGWLVGVTFVVVRGEKISGKLARGGEGGIEHGTVMLGVARALQQRLGVEQFVELEAQFAFIEQQVGHGKSRRAGHARRFNKPGPRGASNPGWICGWKNRPEVETGGEVVTVLLATLCA
ncbi:hypothetical protein D3C76_840910 [compost metagenome]